MRNYTNNYNQQLNSPQEKPRDFNDVLDVFSNQFTPVEKAHGLIALPLNPVLHPIKTIKGVFESYSKLASIPLAVYSGNLGKVPGIISGDEEFSGRDVIEQIAGHEVHGILPSLAGFGLDIAADPFIGVAKLPEEAARSGSMIVHQLAAPGLPQAINHFGL